MGVPKFFAWLMRNYKKSKFVFQKEKEGLEDIDWFLIDANCAIHPICFKILAEEQSKDKINFKSLENKMMNAVIEYFDKLCNYVNPKIGFFIAIDGPVCNAKMKQQRQRRFRSVHDKVLFDKIKTKHHKEIPYYWSNSAISPGTKFMEKLNKKIMEWINTKTIKIIYSSCNVPGEGEHKLLDFIKSNIAKNLNYSYVTYGLDADLIFLMLVTKSDRVYLLREAQQFDNNASKDQLNFVSLKIMKECIYDTFNKKLENENISLDKNRIINDFIFLCYFLGNDFLPHLLALDISRDAIKYLVDKYIETFLITADYLLTKDTKINQEFLKLLMEKLANDENNLLFNNYSKIRKPKYQGNDPYEKEMFKIDNLLFKIDDPIDVTTNPNYRKAYYKHYFDVNDDELEEFVEKMVKNYLIGTLWVANYYFDTITDWDYYYSYDYPPFISDISKYLIECNSIKFKKSKPVTPFEQLLIILPPQSNFLLPTNFQKITSNPISSLAHLYPTDFEIDFLYKHRYWEGIPILPPFEINMVKHIYNKYKDELTADEVDRNKLITEYYHN